MTQLAKTLVSSVRDETDFELLTTVGCADIDRGQAERALGTLYDRYGQLLKGVAEIGRWDERGVDSDALITLTFLKVWAKAGGFDPRKRYRNTTEESAVKLWLLAIFRNAFLDELRKLGRRPDLKLVNPQELDGRRIDSDEDNEDAEDDSPEDDLAGREICEPTEHFRGEPLAAVNSRDVALVQQWLSTLGVDDRTLLLTSVEYIDFKTNKFLIPPEQLNGLAAMLGILPETVKVKRARMLQRLKAFLLEKR